MKVPFCRPYLDKTEKEQLNAVLDSGWLIQGARVSRLEELVAKYVGSSFAVATSSGSTALYLALLACGVSAGDEVIVPSLTWVATAAAVVQCGATPVFCDIDART
ncbi:MAG: DegT/DnrJ/EryC1/StrS aminotransferase family protein, partial [candidate division Zixibacteria bacterium]|nr:DegT/DnrJ/EryC1/StrS aminotransferase family protein [candidate division Zixibacteria bacterium]